MPEEQPVTLDQLARWVRHRTKGCTDLDRVALAVKVEQHLGRIGGRLVADFVEEAHRAGASWSEIGALLGVTKQAAHQRYEARRKRGPFGLRRGGRGRRGASDAFVRFTPAGRQCMVLAQAEARALDHNYVGTEHLLLGVISEPTGVGGTVLREASVTADGVREQVVRIIGRGEETTAGAIPFTPRSKRALETAVREADRAGRPLVGTGALLVGILEQREGVAVQALEGLGVDAATVVERVRAALADQQDV